MTQSTADFEGAGRSLRAFAANPALRTAFGPPDSSLRTLFGPAARRFVAAATEDEVVDRIATLTGKGYRVSVEAVGEEITDPAEIEAVVTGYISLLRRVPVPVQLGFDLSAVGLLRSAGQTLDNTARILEVAAEHDSAVVISMERAEFVNDILGVFGKLAGHHDNVGITVQAHLHRTADDLPAIAATGAKVRLVKGVYAEPADVALPRGPELDARYLDLAARFADAGTRLALATHDAALLDRARTGGLLGRVDEIEMLHGVQPELLRAHREGGMACRVYLTYGDNWWLHLLHRIAEHPPTVITALADLADPDRVVFGAQY
ncbi:proline dehydrogenase family protein [Streptosporangium sp. NBC_01756]|uniref:proline dehydrogenase family protein n=1 Tax=Streptosporangium sp. NBC_01756 TaxID=2975950 RepID=UPI002DD9C022|nr:proline dehydrogenase family protein [Streptosporangium sp. NBC_01756]WSC85990.1 proline dehydrogenase family protein [Streptosporangium sp. NBC_01756]